MRPVPSLRGGFTLFEVAISLALVAVGVLTLALFLPTAIRAQEQARFQVYACAQILGLVENFHASPQLNVQLHAEAAQPWDVPTGRRSFAPDLEARLVAPRHGIVPVPLDIAYRIDSEGDEIRRLLDAGGHLYYANPLATVGIKNESGLAPQPPHEAGRLVFAVIGAPQQNAIGYLPWKTWPYYRDYPSGPVETRGDCWETRVDPDVAYVYRHDFTDGGRSPTWDHDGQGASGSDRYLGMDGRDPAWLGARYYVALALWYAWKKGVPDDLIYGRADAADVAASAGNGDHVRAMRFLAHAAMCMTRQYSLVGREALPELVTPVAEDNRVPPRDRVLRATPPHPGLLTGIPIPGKDSFIDASNAVVQPIPGRIGNGPATLADLYASLPWIPPQLATLPAPPYPAGGAFDPAVPLPQSPVAEDWHMPGHFYLTHDMVVNYHETALALIMRHAAEDPYDWSNLRPNNRAIMTDFPLMQWDVIETATRPRLSGTISGTASDANLAGSARNKTASQWRPLAAADISNFGPNGFTGTPDWNAIKGEGAHFNLTAPFAAAERTRQVVFWTADWQSFEDFETAPSAPVDASRYPKTSPQIFNGTTSGNFTTRLMGWTNRSSNDDDNPTLQVQDYEQPTFRNPEKAALFIIPTDSVQTGTNLWRYTLGPDIYGSGKTDRDNVFYKHRSWENSFDWADYGYSHPTATYNDGTARSDPKAIFNGLFGADRNMNQVLDRGPLPTSARIRAVEIARFNLYDPRLAVTTR